MTSSASLLFRILLTVMIAYKLIIEISAPLASIISPRDSNQIYPKPAKSDSKVRFDKMAKIIAQYKQRNRRSFLMKEASSFPERFCQRNYILAPQHECVGLGNYIFKPLDAFGLGLILDRTLVLHPNQKEDFCIPYQPWVIEFDELQRLYETASCKRPLPKAGDNPEPFSQYLNETYVVGDRFDYACYMDKVDDVIITIPGAGQEATPYRLLRKHINVSLGKDAQRKVDTFLSSPYYPQSHFEFMGILFNNLYFFPEEVLNYTQKTLAKISEKHQESNSTVVHISMHVRHTEEDNRFNPAFDNDNDMGMIHALKQSLMTNFSDRECILLLASDRLHTLRNITREAKLIGCEVIANPYPDEDKEEDLPTDCIEHCIEQGPLAHGVPQLADLLLLSHGEYLIGTGKSTYSQTIGYLIAYNNLIGNNSNDAIYLNFIGGTLYLPQFYFFDPESWIKGCPTNASVHSMISD